MCWKKRSKRILKWIVHSLKDLIFILKAEWQRMEETERERGFLLAGSLARRSQPSDPGLVEPGRRRSLLDSPMGGRDPVTGAPCAFPCALAESWIRNGAAGIQARALCDDHTAQPNPPHHNASTYLWQSRGSTVTGANFFPLKKIHVMLF